MGTAVYRNELPKLNRLIRAGADADACNYDKRSPLHIAAAEGNMAAVEQLVEQGGANPESQVRARARQPPRLLRLQAAVSRSTQHRTDPRPSRCRLPRSALRATGPLGRHASGRGSACGRQGGGGVPGGGHPGEGGGRGGLRLSVQMLAWRGRLDRAGVAGRAGTAGARGPLPRALLCHCRSRVHERGWAPGPQSHAEGGANRGRDDFTQKAREQHAKVCARPPAPCRTSS
jgi:hypothetical protein